MAYLLSVAGIILLFVFLEKAFPLYPKRVFRPGWMTDFFHYLINQYLVNLAVFLMIVPLYLIFGWPIQNELTQSMATLPPFVQFIIAVFVAELAFYWIHRAAHTYPWLWRFHVIHHSSEQLDFLASVRFHPIEMAIARIGVAIPLILLGFSEKTFGGYVIWSVFNSIFVHSNIRCRFPVWLWWLVTPPAFHHWHHAKEVIDKNFGHPWIDWLLGTYHYPQLGRISPGDYGVKEAVPSGYLKQLLFPFLTKKRN